MWDGRYLPFNYTTATGYSKWLNINGINRFWSDFDPQYNVRFIVRLAGWVNEPCPAQWMFGSSQIQCEYAFHGRQSQSTCCPHALTTPGQLPPDCGCRDDVAGTPYRMAYLPAQSKIDVTTFEFNVATLDPRYPADPDGAPDINNGVAVQCQGMALKRLSIAIFYRLAVIDVRFNGYLLDFQYDDHPDPTQKWLTILDLDLSVSDFSLYTPVGLQVRVQGTPLELCPASSLYGSQASCEYFIFGLSNYQTCCPHTVSSW